MKLDPKIKIDVNRSSKALNICFELSQDITILTPRQIWGKTWQLHSNASIFDKISQTKTKKISKRHVIGKK